jgi:hypothetical protein
MGKDDVTLRSCRSGGATSLLQAASLITTVAIYFLNNFKFFWVGVCLQAIAIAGVEVDSNACVACVHRVRTGFAKCKSTLSLLCSSSSSASHLSGMGFFFCTIDESTGDVLIVLRGMGFFSFLNNR